MLWKEATYKTAQETKPFTSDELVALSIYFRDAINEQCKKHGISFKGESRYKKVLDYQADIYVEDTSDRYWKSNVFYIGLSKSSDITYFVVFELNNWLLYKGQLDVDDNPKMIINTFVGKVFNTMIQRIRNVFKKPEKRERKRELPPELVPYAIKILEENLEGTFSYAKDAFIGHIGKTKIEIPISVDEKNDTVEFSLPFDGRSLEYSTTIRQFLQTLVDSLNKTIKGDLKYKDYIKEKCQKKHLT